MQKASKYLIFPIALGAILVDQVSKAIIRSKLIELESIPVIPDVFHLTHTENTGAAFSLFSGQIEALTLVSVIATFLIIAFVLLDKSDFSLFQVVMWGLLLGGTDGNLIDRLFFGSVTDFLDFTIIDFPVFNFADVFIDVGAAGIIILSFIQAKNDRSKKNTN